MLKIDHPQVYTYSYQLSSDSKTAVYSIWTWANSIWQHFSDDKNIIFSEANLTYPLSKVEKIKHSDKIEGSLRFCRVDDSEGILARIGSPETKENQDLEISELKQFNPNNILVAKSHEDWLGQTILITYKSETYQQPSKSDFRQVADECLKNLFPETSGRPLFYHDNELLDSPIFEYTSSNRQLQVFVYLVDDEIEGKIGQILQPLFELFYHRHKITKAFLDSRRNYDLLKAQYLEIEGTIAILETEITEITQTDLPAAANSETSVKIDKYLKSLKIQLKQLLRESLNYERALEYLEDFNNTINIHAYNYQEKLFQIADKWQLPTDDLTIFKFFIDRKCRYFQEQIKGDLGYFKHGTDLIKIAVDLVRGVVDIEQAEFDRAAELREKERDRNLQNTIQAVGTGIGVGVGVAGTIASSYALVEKPWALPSPQHPLLLPHPFVMAILFSFLLGSSLGGLAWWLTKRHLQKKLANSSSTQRSLSDSASQPINNTLQPVENAIDGRNDG